MRNELWGGAFLSLVVACSVLPTKHSNDGEPCQTSSDCDSGRCSADVCERDCTSDRHSCNDGWECKQFPSTNIFTGHAQESYKCVAHCGACPSSLYCTDTMTAKDECGPKPYGPQATLVDPGGLSLGTPVTLRATIGVSQQPAVKFSWSWGDQSPPTETTVPEATHTFMNTRTPAVTLTMTDPKGGLSSTSVTLNLGCAHEGVACLSNEQNGCCDDGLYCTGTCSRLPEITISLIGPDFVEDDHPVTLTAKVENAHEPFKITWSNGGVSWTTSELTHTFDRVSSLDPKLSAFVYDDLMRSASAVKSVTLCGGLGAWCSSEPCCPGMHCSTDAIPKCVKD